MMTLFRKLALVLAAAGLLGTAPRLADAHGNHGQQGQPAATASKRLAAKAKTKRTAKPKRQASGRWIHQPGMLSEVPGVKVPGGRAIFRDAGFPGAPVYLTEYMLKQVGWKPPKGSKAADMWTYRYQEPGNSGTENHKGSGRDHIIGTRTQGGKPSKYGIKGSGINPVFSGINGPFSIANFRQNGLMELPESLAEQGIGLRMTELGGPVSPHRQMVLLPDEIQHALSDAAGDIPGQHWTRRVAVQVVRDLSDPRESYEPATQQEAVRFLGFQAFHNIGHGASAPANLARGLMLDLGHISFGYPVTSGLYRCTVCKGAEGTTANTPDWFLSTVAHYFPAGKKGQTSYSFRLEKRVAEDIVHEVMKQVSPGAARPTFSQHDLRALTMAFRERIGFKNGIDYERDILGFGEKLMGMSLPRDVKPHRMSISTRFIMQVAGLRQVLPAAEADRARDILYGMSSNKQAVHRLYRIFDGMMAQSRPTRAQLKTLYDQEIPTNVVIDRIDGRLARVPKLDMPKVQKAAQEVLTRDVAPVEVTPERFFDVMEQSFGSRI
jgi:hypothetical protein